MRIGDGGDDEPGGPGDVVAVAHPDVEQRGAPPWSLRPLNNASGPGSRLGVAEFALVGGFGRTARAARPSSACRSRCRATAIRCRAPAGRGPPRTGGRFRPAGQDDAFGAEGAAISTDRSQAQISHTRRVRAPAAGDQLGVPARRSRGSGSCRNGFGCWVTVVNWKLPWEIASPFRVNINRRGNSAVPW